MAVSSNVCTTQIENMVENGKQRRREYSSSTICAEVINISDLWCSNTCHCYAGKETSRKPKGPTNNKDFFFRVRKSERLENLIHEDCIILEARYLLCLLCVFSFCFPF